MKAGMEQHKAKVFAITNPRQTRGIKKGSGRGDVEVEAI